MDRLLLRLLGGMIRFLAQSHPLVAVEVLGYLAVIQQEQAAVVAVEAFTVVALVRLEHPLKEVLAATL